MRKEFEMPEAIEKWGWKYHHTGMPTTEKLPIHELTQRVPHVAFVVEDLDFELANRNFNIFFLILFHFFTPI